MLADRPSALKRPEFERRLSHSRHIRWPRSYGKRLSLDCDGTQTAIRPPRHLGNTMEQERSRAPLFYLTAALFYFSVLVSLPLVLGAGGCLGTTTAQADAGAAAISTPEASEPTPPCDGDVESVDCEADDSDSLSDGSSSAGL